MHQPTRALPRLLAAGLCCLACDAATAQRTYAHNEQFFDGTLVEGNYLSTHADDGVCESIQEVQSGGKPAKRRSYLGHLWVFDVPPGAAQTFAVKAFLTDSGEGDAIRFRWSVDDVTYTPFLTYDVGSAGSLVAAPLPTEVSGPLLIWMEDVDRTAGNRVLDTFSIDWMYVETTANNAAPAAPDQLVARPMSITVIDLAWADNSSNESGFRVERSVGGGDFEVVALVGAGVTAHMDENLAPAAVYTYRVFAFNTHGDSPPSTSSEATTLPANSFDLEMVRPGGTHPVHALDADGHPIVAYHLDGTFEFARFDGVSWNYELIDGSWVPASHVDPAHLIVSPFGQIGCAWLTTDTPAKIMFAERIHATWLVEQVDTTKNYWRTIHAAYDPAGNPCVVYDDAANSRRGSLRLARRVAGMWQSEVVDDTEPIGPGTALAFDPGGDPAVVYSVDLDGDGHGDMVRFARRSGGNWTSQAVGPCDNGAMLTVLAFQPVSGLPAILYGQFFGEVRFLQWDGTTWQTEVPALGDVPVGLAFDSGGRPHISYRALDPSYGSRFRCYAVRDGSSWWHELVALDGGPYNTGRLVLDAQGRASIVFRGDLDAQRGVILARQ